jgi:hypothetical protein
MPALFTSSRRPASPAFAAPPQPPAARPVPTPEHRDPASVVPSLPAPRVIEVRPAPAATSGSAPVRVDRATVAATPDPIPAARRMFPLALVDLESPAASPGTRAGETRTSARRP